MAVTISAAKYPEYSAGTGISGKRLVMYLNYGTDATAVSPVWALVGGVTSNSLSFSAEATSQQTKESEMMAVGKQKCERMKDGGSSVEFVYGNAQQMPFPDEQFDAVTCAYGVRNFADLDAGLQEMYRVMKTGGELTILEFGYPENQLIRWIYDRYFSTFLPFVGRLLSRDKTAYTYLNESVKHFCYADDFLAHLQNAGFEGTHFCRQTFGISYLYKAYKLKEK